MKRLWPVVAISAAAALACSQDEKPLAVNTFAEAASPQVALSEAVEASKRVNTYGYTQLETTLFEGEQRTINSEGAIDPPDRIFLRSTSAERAMEFVRTARTLYTKYGDEPWTWQPSGEGARPVESYGQQIAGFMKHLIDTASVQSRNVNGVATRCFEGRVDIRPRIVDMFESGQSHYSSLEEAEADARLLAKDRVWSREVCVGKEDSLVHLVIEDGFEMKLPSLDPNEPDPYHFEIRFHSFNAPVVIPIPDDAVPSAPSRTQLEQPG